MSQSAIKTLEGLPGIDEYGLFLIEKVGYTKDGGIRVNARYDEARDNSEAYWYYNADGSMYKKNPDGSSTYRSPTGLVKHKHPTFSRTTIPQAVVSPLRGHPDNTSLPCRASGVVFFGWPLFIIYPGRFLLTISINVVFLVLILSICALFSQKDHVSDFYQFPYAI